MLEDKNAILNKIKTGMDSSSKFHIISPNNESFHRLLGLEMNLINDLEEQSVRDKSVSAKQDLNWDKLRKLLIDAGFNILKEEGILFKLFENKKMSSLDSNMVSALFNLETSLNKMLHICIYVVS